MNLADLSAQTGIDRRRLRYILDHQLVPPIHVKIIEDAPGRPRHFDASVGFGIACAATLLDQGFSQGGIRRFLDVLLNLQIAVDRTSAIAHVLNQNVEAFAELGDGHYVRLRGGRFDSGWVPPMIVYTPRTLLTLDIRRIYDDLFRN